MSALSAPNHWVTGRDGLDVSQAPLSTLVAPVVVIDKTAEVEKDADFLPEISHVRDWEAEHGPLPEGGWLLYRTGWASRGSDDAAFANADENGSHTPASRPSARDGWPGRPWSPASAWRPSAPTPDWHPCWSRRSRATPS